MKIAKGGSKELYASFRILAMETSEIDSDDLVDRAISGEKVSTLNDNLMSTILSSILRSTLSSYPTSLHVIFFFILYDYYYYYYYCCYYLILLFFLIIYYLLFES